jgi:DNA polymerase-3 subunit gamma/tau
MGYVVLALKWRPQTFDEVAGQRSVCLVLKRALETGRTGHAYLFAGPRGVGKTSTARILAKALNCEKGPTPEPCNACDACREIAQGSCMDVLEIDGASNRGIDDIRELKETIRYAPSRYRTKVTIIDEVHMLTTDAFNALLKTLEEPPPHAVFILATTEPLKVPQTILSRCQRFDFGRLNVPQIVEHLGRICEAEGIAMDRDALTLLARRAEGSVRDALTLLDQVAASGPGPFGAKDVQQILGIAGSELYFAFTDAMARKDLAGTLRLVDEAYAQGLHLGEIMEELVRHVRNLLVVATDPELKELLDATDEERQRYREQAEAFRPEDLLRILRILMDEAGRMRRSPFARLHLEVALAECATLPGTADLARMLQALGPQASGAGRMGEVDAPPARAAAVPAGLEEKWQRVVERVKHRKMPLGASLAHCRAVSLDGETLRVQTGAQGAFLETQLEQAANKRLVQEAVGEVFGPGVRIRFQKEGNAAQEAAPAEEDPVKRIARYLGGDIEGPA